jgi:hypothetical protein
MQTPSIVTNTRYSMLNTFFSINVMVFDIMKGNEANAVELSHYAYNS